MGKKTTPAKEKKPKASKKARSTKPAPTTKRTDKAKPQDKAVKVKPSSAVAKKSVEKPARSRTQAAQKGEKAENKSAVGAAKSDSKTVVTAAKDENKSAASTAKANTKPAPVYRAPPEIGGLPKISAVRGPLDRAARNDTRATLDEDSGGDGDRSDDNASGPVKTYLTDEELQEFRDLLLAKRQEIIRDVTNLEDQAIRQASGSATSSSMPIHMADLGTDTWEQELTLGLIENERSLLREIDEALERVDNKTYGICLATNKRISKARLQAKPWAKYCIEYARKRELGLA